MKSKRYFFQGRVPSARAWPAGLAGLVMMIAVGGCTSSYQTGVYALPVSPQTTPTVGAPPQTGPTSVPDRECKQAAGEYRLGSGDRIRVVVLSDTEFSADYEVNSTGAVQARMLGAIPVTGMTTAELEQILKDRYTAAGYLRQPRLSVELVGSRPFFILGEISRPGAFGYLACLRVIQAVTIAGGYTRRASKSRMTIRRFFSNFAEEEYVSEDTLVEPGDVLRIPERYF